MPDPLVTVIIRSMGRPVLRQALDSVAAQDYPDIEVCVVAASGAAHPPLAAQCGSFPLRLAGTGLRLPRADAANFGLDAARGDYCVFLDDDDYYEPDHVSSLLRTLQASPPVRVAYSAIRLIRADGSQHGFLASPYDRLGLHERNFIQIGAALFDRTLAREGCRFDPEVGSYDDWDFWLQCSERTDFAYSNKPTTNWRIEAGDSGAGGGANFDTAVNEASRAAVQAKWSAVRDQLIDRLIARTESGYAAQQQGDATGAQAAYEEALRIHPTDPYALNLLAMLLHGQGNTSGALSCLRFALRAHPERGEIALNLARIEVEAGNATPARRLLEILVQREPENALAHALLSRIDAAGAH